MKSQIETGSAKVETPRPRGVRRVLPWIIALSALGFAAWWLLRPVPPTPVTDTGAFPIGVAPSTARLEVGAPAPDFVLSTLDGGQISLSELRGKPVLINFWASWCPPCRVEMPHLVAAYDRYHSQGFVILGIDLTFQDDVGAVRDFVNEFDMNFPVLLDETGEVTQKYLVYGIPTSIFVDREGVVKRIHAGPMTPDQLDSFVKEIL